MTSRLEGHGSLALTRVGGPDGGWQPLPAWALWFSRVGTWAAELASDSRSCVIAISVPTRAYAAVMTGCGIVAGLHRPRLNRADWRPQFARAARIPDGTPTRIVDTRGPTVSAGLFYGVETPGGVPRYRIAGSRFPADRYRLDVLPGAWDLQALAGSLTRTKLDEADFLTAALPGIDAQDFAGFSAADCLLIGALTALRSELGTPVGAENSPDRSGTLGNVMRCQMHGQAPSPFRSAALPAFAGAEDVRGPFGAATPKSLVLDGAHAVVRWLHGRSAPVAVAAVDRTEPAAQEAAATLKQDRARSVCDVSLPPRLLPPPPGIEVLAWQHREAEPWT